MENQKGRNINFFLIMILVVLCPYLINWFRIKDLNNENQKLLKEVEALQKQVSVLYYHPIIKTDRSTMKLGEEYKAYVGLSLLDMHNLPKVVVCEYKNNKLYSTKDTLVYNPYEQLFEYKFKPKKAGTYTWGGMIFINSNGINKRFPIIGKYTVTN